jgi:ribosome-binding protein aMBF1 (putative translation factor)
MITNERQYRITKAQLGQLRAALQAWNGKEARERTSSAVLAKAEREALQSQVEDLLEQVSEYEALKSGAVGTLTARGLEELPGILVRARIAGGLSQRQLAEKLGLKEQQIQRYEAENYATASLKRLVKIAEALDLEISETAVLR